MLKQMILDLSEQNIFPRMFELWNLDALRNFEENSRENSIGVLRKLVFGVSTSKVAYVA